MGWGPGVLNKPKVDKTATTKAAADKAAAAAQAAAQKAAQNTNAKNQAKLDAAAAKAQAASDKAAATAKAAYDASPAGRAANNPTVAQAPIALPQAPASVPSTAQSIFGAQTPAMPGPSGSALDQARNVALLQGADAAGKSNESQFQDTSKASSFASQGTTQQNQTQQQAQSVNATQVGKTAVDDTLGLGALLQTQKPVAQAATNTQQAFLTDLVANGDPRFNQKLDTAIRASQSGQVQNAGESAKARMGAYAAERVAQDNQNLRLNAAQQLAGPTAVTTLSQAGTPYLGQSTSGQSQQLQNTLSNLLSNESSSQQGASQGLTSVNSVGKQPVQSSGGGMSVVCTVLQKHGLLDTELVRAEVAYFRERKDKHFNAWKAYYVWGRKFAKWLDGKPVAMGLTAAVVKRLIAVPAGKGGWFAKIVWHTLLFGHHVAGWFVKDSVWDADFYNQSLEYGTNLFYGE